MSEKHDNFIRLADARIETITEAFRIFSNLSGPSYEWTAGEVMAYFARVDEAKEKAIARFRESKKWIEPAARGASAAESPPDPEPEGAPAAAAEAEEAPEPPAEAPEKASRQERRTLTIAMILRQAEKDGPEMLAETVAMQREVIADLQSRLDHAR